MTGTDVGKAQKLHFRRKMLFQVGTKCDNYSSTGSKTYGFGEKVKNEEQMMQNGLT